MKQFVFRLEKALELRQKQLELAEAEFQRRKEAIAAAERMAVALKASVRRETSAVHASRPILGGALASLGGYHRHVLVREKELEAQRAACIERAAEAERAMLEARRRARLLEKLKQRRLGEWQTAAGRELEELASDSYLAQWNRRRT